MSDWIKGNKGLCAYVVGLYGTLILLYFLFYVYVGNRASDIILAYPKLSSIYTLIPGGSFDTTDLRAVTEFLNGFVLYVIACFAGLGLIPIFLWRSTKFPVNGKRALCRWTLFSFLYLCMSQIVVFSFMETPGFHNYGPAAFDDVMNLRAHKPIADRLLVPVLVRKIVDFFPEHFKERVEYDVRNNAHFQKITVATLGKTGVEFELAVTVVVLIIFHFFAMVCIGNLAAAVYELDLVICRIVIPIIYAMVHPIFFSSTAYIYDIPNLCFTAMGLWLIFSNRIKLFLLLYPIVLLNRATFVTFSVVFALVMIDRLPLRKYCAYMAYQAIAFIGIKFIFLAWLNKGLPALSGIPWGGAIQNFNWLTNSCLWYFLTDVQLTLFYFPAIIYVVLLGCAFNSWRTKHPALKRALLAASAFLIPLSFFKLTYPEWRGLLELYPIVFLLAGETIGRWFTDFPHRDLLPVADDRSIVRKLDVNSRFRNLLQHH